jgi:hypothetical protein
MLYAPAEYLRNTSGGHISAEEGDFLLYKVKLCRLRSDTGEEGGLLPYEAKLCRLRSDTIIPAKCIDISP